MDSKIELMQWMIKIMDAQNPRAQFCLLSFYRASGRDQAMDRGMLFKNTSGRWEIRSADGSVLWEITSGDVIEIENMLGRMITTRVEFGTDYYTVMGIQLKAGLFARAITRGES